MITSTQRQTAIHIVQAIAFVMFLIALAATARHVSRLDRWQQIMEGGRATLNDLSRLRTAAADAEAASLQYVMTGNEQHLEPYDAAQLEIRDTLPRLDQHLTNLAVDLSVPRRALEKDFSDKIDACSEIHTLRHNRGYDAAQLFILTGRSQTLDERLRMDLNAMSEAVLEFQDVESSRIARLGRASLRWLTITSVLCIALLGLLTWEARNTPRRREMSTFQRMAENSGALMRLTGPDGECVFANNSWLALTGKTLPQFLDWGWLNFVHHDDRGPAIALHRDAATRRETRTGTYRVARTDGSYVTVQDTLSAVVDENGRFEGLVSFAVERPESSARA